MGRHSRQATFGKRRRVNAQRKTLPLAQPRGRSATRERGELDHEFRVVLSASDLFAGLDDAGRDAVLAAASSRRFARGSTLLCQDDAPGHLYLVGSGLVKMSQLTPGGAQFTLSLMGPGDVIGCAAVFQQFPYPATATVVEDSVILAWTTAHVAELMKKHPQLVRNALGVVGSRAHEFVLRLGETATKRAEQRIASAVLRLVRQTGRSVEDGVEVALSASRRDLAELTGATYFTVSRTLSAWKNQGIIDVGRHRILVKAPRRLFEIAEDL